MAGRSSGRSFLICTAVILARTIGTRRHASAMCGARLGELDGRQSVSGFSQYLPCFPLRFLACGECSAPGARRESPSPDEGGALRLLLDRHAFEVALRPPVFQHVLE